MYVCIYIYIYIYIWDPPPPPKIYLFIAFPHPHPPLHTHRDTHTNTPPTPPKDLPLHRLSTPSPPHPSLHTHRDTHTHTHSETHTHPPTHPHAQEELADVPFCGWVNPTPRILGTGPGPVQTGTTGTSCTGGFQHSKIPRLLELLESLFLESWNLEFPRYNLYRLYRFVPAGVFQDSKKRLPSNLGILDSAGTTCTGCTGLYRAKACIRDPVPDMLLATALLQYQW